jgi:membrane protein
MSAERKKFTNIWNWLHHNSTIWQGIEHWAKRVSLPGFHGVQIYYVLHFIREELRREDLMTRANSVAFSFFLAIFPGMIAMFTMLAYLPIFENIRTRLEEGIGQIMPGDAGNILLASIKDILTKQRGGLLSIGFLLTLYFSSNGMMALMKGFDKEHKISFRRRAPIHKRLIAFELTFLMVFLLVASIVLVILGNTLIALLTRWAVFDQAQIFMISGLRWLTIIMLYYFCIAALYRFGAPSRKPIPLFSPGTTLATVGSLLFSLVFSSYIDNFGNYNKLYGSIGAIIVLMLWLQLNAIIILLGFELNAAIMINRDQRLLADSQ